MPDDTGTEFLRDIKPISSVFKPDGLRHQRGEPRDEILRLEHHVRRAPPAAFAA